MKLALLVINLIAFVAATIWCLVAPDWEPVITTIVSFGALIAQAFVNDEIKSKLMKLVQKSNKDNSHNYGAANDLIVTDNKNIQTGGNRALLIQGEW